MNEKRCFLCMSKMDESTGLCKNPKCVRSKPLPEPKAAQYVKTEEKKEE